MRYIVSFEIVNPEMTREQLQLAASTLDEIINAAMKPYLGFFTCVPDSLTLEATQ